MALKSTVYRYRFLSDKKELKDKVYKLKAKVWAYPGMAAWHFVSVPTKTSKLLKVRYGTSSRGWGSLPVTVTIGRTTWQTSIFPDKKSGTYLLPLKSEVRLAERILKNKIITFSLQIKN